MDEQRSEGDQRSRGNQSLVVLTGTNQSYIHRIFSGLSLREHTVDGVGSVTRRDFDGYAKLFLKHIDHRPILARRSPAGSDRNGPVLLGSGHEFRPLLFEVRRDRRRWFFRGCCVRRRQREKEEVRKRQCDCYDVLISPLRVSASHRTFLLPHRKVSKRSFLCETSPMSKRCARPAAVSTTLCC